MNVHTGIVTLKKLHTKLLRLQEELNNTNLSPSSKTELMQAIMRTQRDYNETLEKTRASKKLTPAK